MIYPSQNNHNLAFLAAAQSGDLSALQRAFAKGALPVVTDVWGASALLFSAHYGHTSCLSFLLTIPSVQPQAFNETHDTALHNAARYSHKDCVVLLLPVSHPISKILKVIRPSFVRPAQITSIALPFFCPFQMAARFGHSRSTQLIKSFLRPQNEQHTLEQNTFPIEPARSLLRL